MIIRIAKTLSIVCIVALVIITIFITFRKSNAVALESSAKKSISKLEAAPQRAASSDSENKNKKANEEKKEIKITFFGDLMLDRDVRTLMARKNPDFITEKIQRLFDGQDLIVVNLEGPITQNETVSVGTKMEEKNHFAFTFDPEKTMQFLKHNKINVVDLGNNHSLNFKAEGLNETKSTLASSGVNYFGDPLDANNYLVKNINDKKISVVSYNQFSGISADEAAAIIREVKKKSDFIIVYAHWGKEYELKEIDSQKEKAHLFVDAGADLIIGSHPHVVEPLEMYKNKMIFYSLGNFVFDQYFSEDTKTMLAVGITIKDENLEIILEPLYQEKSGQIILAPEQKRQTLLSRLANDSTVDYNMKQGILDGYLQVSW